MGDGNMAAREMTLQEWVGTLPNPHNARAELTRLTTQRDELREALKAIQQRANEHNGTSIMAVLDTVHALAALARTAIENTEASS